MDIDSLLKPFQHFGVHLGLERIIKLLANLGNPHHQVPVIHVAGTNGKGSVCAYLSSVLTEAGYRTGRYTSPHLVDWTERICLDEKAIASENLCQLLLQVQSAISLQEESPTQFEVITSAAWLYFAQQKVDVAVVEVGLGGRLDATNVCEKPLVTVITSISREHWQQLGPTVADIAREKAGILKSGCPAVIGQLPPDAEKVVRARIQELGCPVYIPQPSREIATGWAEYLGEAGEQGSRGEGGEKDPTPNSSIKYPLPLQGQIQLANSALALTALKILQNASWEKITEAVIVNGMAKTRWLGRMQWTTWRNHKLLIDGAHNPAAAKVLRDYVDNSIPPFSPSHHERGGGNEITPQHSMSWVMGMLRTKDHADIFRALLRSNDQLYLVPVPDNNSANPNELAKLAREICPDLSISRAYPNLSSALEAAFTPNDNLVVLCGSLYLIGHFLSKLGVRS
ncbi:MAG: bifunctional folylpolyglutamate synthase/dihydrofolate synthase [Cyanomargarita calcarea GSE-NOS-MK-12-04C]|uniref:tetrahydrofolate synthase n=1 Tax=Cyanomargarita calcarea GSE-NOS-MK-12-04C TaxID=2839659 RepID=A0A951US32_9CYAN|nr:bifunctional folylpolyglutamate synthase/dihydrofolate synthase [Cyanomargarita calcarea GSE-NOS-MK-12-04C]